MSWVTGVVGAGVGGGVGSTGTAIGATSATCGGGAGRATRRRTARYVTRQRTRVPIAMPAQNTAGLVAAVATALGLLAGRPRVVDAEDRSGAGTDAVLTTVRLAPGTRSDDVPSSSSSVSSYAPTVAGTPSVSGVFPLIRWLLTHTPLRLFRSAM